MKYRVFITVFVVEVLLIGGLFLHAFLAVRRAGPEVRHYQDIARILMLTDLSVWTEARYTRHPSQADWFAPFQDFPSAIEHFPAGSVLSPTGLLQEGGLRK